MLCIYLQQTSISSMICYITRFICYITRFILNITEKTKVDLIAHSLGGLIVSAYLERYGNENIGKLIILAAPYEVSPIQ